MKKTNQIWITGAEWELMCVLWDAGVPCPPDDIYKALKTKMNCSTRTMRTHLDRLVRKGAVIPVKSESFARTCSYYVPAVDRATATENRKKNILKEFFGTTISSMLTAFIQNGEVSKTELTELKGIIESEINRSEDEKKNPSDTKKKK